MPSVEHFPSLDSRICKSEREVPLHEMLVLMAHCQVSALIPLSGPDRGRRLGVPDPSDLVLAAATLIASNKPAIISLRTSFAHTGINIQTLLISIFVPRLISSQHPQPTWQRDAEAGYANCRVEDQLNTSTVSVCIYIHLYAYTY